MLNRVDRAAFREAFEEHHAVQYFYEPFLEAYDPALRKQLGVWYTPPEIVTYMVERVDSVLRSELGIADGLADQSVVILDPCCGTGSYVVEVLRRIEKTLIEKGKTALTANAVKKAAMERVFGFEIMPAPYVISHLQVGIALQHIGAPLSESANERAAVYLTNSLTGWEPPTGPKQHIIAFPQLEQERDAADEVKRTKPIIVILGNPPYNAFAGVSPAEEMGLVEPYKEGLVTEWKIKKFNLDDLYVRFFRIAERRIAEHSKKGVVAFISNHSWISDPSFVMMRKHLLDSFDRFSIENLHGNRKISEYAPNGKTSETIFAVHGFSPGIRQGVATSLWIKCGEKSKTPKVLFRDDLNEARAADRRTQLLDSLKASDFDAGYEPSNPEKSNRYSFRPSKSSKQYSSWPKIIDLCAMPPINGLMEKRGGALIDVDRSKLEKRMLAYFNPKLEWSEYSALGYGLVDKQAGFDPKNARRKALESEAYDANRVVRYAIRPFDTRWCYFTAVPPVWNRARPQLWAQNHNGNEFLITRPAGVASPEGIPFHFTRCLGDNDFLRGHAYYIPTTLKGPIPRKNLSSVGRSYLEKLGELAKDDFLLLHCLAVGYAPTYLSENAGGIRGDWPRIPLPDSKDALIHSAELGRRIANLLDTENPVAGVTTDAIRPELKEIAVIWREGDGSLEPTKGHLAMTAGWGHAGKDGAVMPGKGLAKIRDYSPAELGALETGAKKLGMSCTELMKRFGEQTMDIYLNGVAYWKNIPALVWEYTIGGYQVIKKWLSYRERDLLGRDLSTDEIDEVTAMARRIAAIVLLKPALDANYTAVKASPYDWPSTNLLDQIT